ncbi:enolase C-terminal domain-like protein [Phytoactinopolyspora limicola]|uniref:enolase C-terminal domain-like protein n=1 Tax=Phytoactinopolyspora limicola TaxID=2715536 RepID=UPI001408DA93|nr:enolase C-terminal domain-like protein [Phytoactinopolyspora limicola]
MTTIAGVKCRLFAASSDGPGELYANPLRAWDGSGDGETSFGFHEWLVVEVELSTGEVGIGNAALGARLARDVVTRYLEPVVVGESPADREKLWQRMYRTVVAFGRRGAGMAAVSAVDIAIWDAEARRLGVPVYELLGGQNRPRIPVYASQLYPTADLDALAAEARGYVEQGFGMVKQRFLWGPADGREGMRKNVELVRTVREAVGDAADVAADAYMGWDLDYARRMAWLLEPFDLRWLEEPLLPDDVVGYRELRRVSPVPVAAGEHEATLAGFYHLITTGAVDVAQPDVNRVGGLTPARKVCALAEAAGVPVVPHAGQVHNYHLVASQPACPMAEYFPVNPQPLVGNEMPHLLFGGEPIAKDGHIELAQLPGLGITVAPRGPVYEQDPADGEVTYGNGPDRRAAAQV